MKGQFGDDINEDNVGSTKKSILPIILPIEYNNNNNGDVGGGDILQKVQVLIIFTEKILILKRTYLEKTKGKLFSEKLEYENIKKFVSQVKL